MADFVHRVVDLGKEIGEPVRRAACLSPCVLGALIDVLAKRTRPFAELVVRRLASGGQGRRWVGAALCRIRICLGKGGGVKFE